MSKPITLQLTLTVTFNPGRETIAALTENMAYIAENAASQGLMTGDGPAEVHCWSKAVEQVATPPDHR